MHSCKMPAPYPCASGLLLQKTKGYLNTGTAIPWEETWQMATKALKVSYCMDFMGKAVICFSSRTRQLGKQDFITLLIIMPNLNCICHFWPFPLSVFRSQLLWIMKIRSKMQIGCRVTTVWCVENNSLCNPWEGFNWWLLLLPLSSLLP